MKNQKNWLLIIALCVLTSILWAADKTEDFKPVQIPILVDEKGTLKDLKGVYVLIESLTPQANQKGLTEQQLQTDVELKLRQNGIKVLTREESFSAPGSPYLYLNVNVVISDRVLSPYNISLQLKQNVILSRDNICCKGITWEKGGTGIAGEAALVESVRGLVKDVVDMFINDYLAVNPKK
jgi:hypothetical protein